MKNKLKATFLVFSAVAITACVGNAPEAGIRQTPAGDGPVVNWNVFARPVPDIPFPNDIATYNDPGSPTGKRINASFIGPTELESLVRRPNLGL